MSCRRNLPLQERRFLSAGKTIGQADEAQVEKCRSSGGPISATNTFGIGLAYPHISFKIDALRTGPKSPIGQTVIGNCDFFDEKHARKAYDDERRIIATGVPLKNVEEMETWPDGTVTWSSTTKVAMYDDSGAVVGIVGISRDITERKLQEKHLQQVTRLYAAMSQMYQTILGAQTRKQLFSEVCRALVESAQFDMAWIGLIHPGDPEVEPAAKFGDHYDYLRKVRIFSDKRADGGGPVGTAIREESIQVVNNFQNCPSTAPWYLEAVQSGWLSCASVPIRIADQAAGALTVYSKTPGYFSDKEMILLERAGADISSSLKMVDALAALQ